MLVKVIARNVLLEGVRLAPGIQEVADNRYKDLINAGVAVLLAEEVIDVVAEEVEVKEVKEDERTWGEIKEEAKELGLHAHGKKKEVVLAEIEAKKAE